MGRFIHPGKATVVFAPAATLAAPTDTQIAAGQVLTEPSPTPAVEGMTIMSGWETTANNVATPDVADTFDTTIPGRTSGATPTAEFYRDDTPGGEVFEALVEGDDGYVIIGPAGLAVADECEVWPVRISTVNASQVDNTDTPAKFMVTFAVTSPPEKRAVVADGTP
jgi:hypothetical protein